MPSETSVAGSSIAEAAIQLAQALLLRSQQGQRPAEKREAAQMARLMEDPSGKAFLFAMVDETFRSNRPGVEARRWRGLLGEYGLPKYPAITDRAMMRLGALASNIVPQIVMPLVASRMRAETARVILDGDPEPLSKYLQARRAEGFRINLNHLGEAVLGEGEAQNRLRTVLDSLEKPEVTYISVKISALFSQINLLAWDDTLDEIKARLRQLYRAALPQKKFVNLDMEEYRDLALTLAAFQQVLEEPEFTQLTAGIVLQAYLPDSWAAQQALVQWARERVSGGGAPIKIRLVKGANLAMEKVEAEMHGWHPAPYASKQETDANFRRMLEWGCRPENASAARIGVASHNLFDVALALVLREKQGVSDMVEIELAVSSVSRRKTPAVNAQNSPHFENEPDSDWTQGPTRDALWQAVKDWQPLSEPKMLPLEEVLETARQAQPGWADLGLENRGQILTQAAQVLADRRFESSACMHATAQKAVPEADAEVSEAIDFARYYSRFRIPDGIEATALGVVAVVPPWNFPYAIPCGGILAALVAGNSVIFKPAPEVVEVAHLLAQQLWEAGVPRDVLQFFPCDDGEVGQALITDDRVAAVVLTGSIETARLFQSWRPSLKLLAETSGKNALLITAQADRELAIKDLVKSAFGHSGQKCSAASLAIVEAEVYHSPDFRRQLHDAAASLSVGPATDARSAVTPLVQAPGESLLRALTTLDEGEEWLLEPHQVSEDVCAWSPGIKLGVRAGSWFHQTECFGPVLGVMCANSLEQAIEWQNGTKFGLTAGIHTLDSQEVNIWRDAVQAGNLYVNRATTGAIVQRQPFGGWKASSIGTGAKAGGPNYVLNFYVLRDKSPETDFVASYQAAWDEHFSQQHDPSCLHCESNLFRYRRARGVILRLRHRDEDTLQRAQLAARLTGTPLTISIADEEADPEFARQLPALAESAEFLRTDETPSNLLLCAAYEAGLNWINAPLTAHGRVELRFWLREQAISQTLHRYGQISEQRVSRWHHS